MSADRDEADRRSIPRLEDPRLLRGEGDFVADRQPPGTLHAHFVRSPIAHGNLINVNCERAAALPGVHAVLTVSDLVEIGAIPLKVGWNHPGQRITETGLLASDRVRWVGQAIAVVLADSLYLAEDAGELVELELEPLPAITSAGAAIDADAAKLYPDWADNVLAEYTAGVPADPELFDRAAITLSEKFSIQRLAASPLEGRAALAVPELGSDRVTAWISTQTAHHASEVISEACGWPTSRLRVITPDVGGAFGLKEAVFAEDVITCLLAGHFRRPVKWIEDRRENLIGSAHCRQCEWDLELAADEEGRILALRGELLYDMGGEPTGVGIGFARVAAEMLGGPYRIESIEVKARGVVTNKTPAGAYRGYGGPEAAFAIERLVDLLACRLNLPPQEVRRRNFVQPDQFPYSSASGMVYDSGNYEEALDLALARSDFAGFERRRDEARELGRLRGIGMASFVKPSGLTNSRIMAGAGTDHGNAETVTIRISADGAATVLSGVSSQGQGHETILAQVCADVLGLDPEREVSVLLGDSQMTPYSSAGAINSRVAIIAGAAVRLAAEELRTKLQLIAGGIMDVAPSAVILANSQATAGEESVPISQLARAALTGFELPDGVEAGLEQSATYDPPNGTFPYGTHVVEIEIEPDSGAIEIVRYVAVNDSGVLLNPAIVDGQLSGAIAQGIGGALLEEIAYDANGQIQTASLMDYLLPTACEIPRIEIEHLCTPAPHIPGGVKGVGESGILAPAPAIANAIADAIGQAARPNNLPFSPPVVWAMVRGVSITDRIDDTQPR